MNAFVTFRNMIQNQCKSLIKVSTTHEKKLIGFKMWARLSICSLQQVSNLFFIPHPRIDIITHIYLLLKVIVL